MAYPLIILGAGASFDYLDTDRNTKDSNWSPPLTNQIFNVRKYESILNKYPEAMELFSDAYRKVPHSMSLEEYLREVKHRKAAEAEHRQKQLNALEFYLQDLFFTISNNYGNQALNNYKTLLGLINDNGGKACIVSFNYDLLLEQNITFIDEKISSYISGDIKLIKLHGSCDWVSYVRTFFPYNGTSYQFLMNEPWYFTLPNRDKPKLLESRRPYDQMYKIHNQEEYVLFPAIAIPISEKEVYICPQSHIEELKKTVEATDRILIIGWRAGDPNLIKILEEHVIKPVKVSIVSSSQASGEEVKRKLEHIHFLTLEISKKRGFTEFLKSDEPDKFFEGR